MNLLSFHIGLRLFVKFDLKSLNHNIKYFAKLNKLILIIEIYLIILNFDSKWNIYIWKINKNAQINSNNQLKLKEEIIKEEIDNNNNNKEQFLKYLSEQKKMEMIYKIDLCWN